MKKQRKVVDAQADKNGNITSVKIQGNKSFTPLSVAIKLAERNELSNVVAVHPNNGNTYLRSKPDSKKNNNLDDLANKK
ncbi:MAG: DUF3892 domain-containing protein [Ignavibacteriae bacterium]|nr:DUF3892 domain-containing protein [Ignavibacteriota bacterium]NOG99301.1 DUF3892 domain-containing protein [Ignavibacteriota bacterium]